MATNTIELSPSQALELMEQCHAIGEPVYIEGSRGIGKTELIGQLAKKVGATLTPPLILCNMEPMDLRGLPYTDQATKKTVWSRPVFMPDQDAPGKHIFFVDEIASAEPRMQVPLYQLFLEHRIGEHYLPADTWVAGAGNIFSDQATLYELQGPLLSRCTVIRLRVSAPDWDAWAFENNVAPEVRSFIKIHPEFLDASTLIHRNEEDRITPNPRAWGKAVSNYIHRFGAKNSPDARAFIAGKVGLSVAEEFMTMLRELSEIPDCQTIRKLAREAVQTKSNTKLLNAIPAKMSCLYGVCSSLSRSVNTEQDVLDSIAALNILASVKDNLPRRDVRVMGMSLLLETPAMKTLDNRRIAKSEEWSEYSKSQNLKEVMTFA